MGLLERKYRCTFCNRDFKRKTWFEKHMCDKKQRFIDSNNITVIRAHRLFNHWQRRTGLLRSGKMKNMEDFCKSPFYSAFVKLADFSSQEYVVSSYKYVDWLVDHNIPEKDWYREDRLEQFREYVRKTEDPESQVETTIKNIAVWCEDHRIEQVEFFSSITPGQALNMVRENRLSPWVLLGYERCLDELVARFSGELEFALDDHINLSYWIDKVRDEKETSNLVQKICQEYFNGDTDSDRTA